MGCSEHEAVVCDDGDWCNGTETCDTELGCQAGTPVDCDDGNPCTVDSCDEDEDECVHEPDDDLCDDGDVCTIDVCDVEEGCLHTFDDTDADGDGIPDCLSCPPLDVVFVMDTSGTMADEAGVLCANIDDVIAKLGAAGVEFDATIWGISQTPGGDFDCLTDTVANVLGTAVPGNPPCCRGLAGREDWGSAVAIVAAEYPWTPGAARVIVPLADEGPGAGDPCDDPGNDRDAITHAIDIAVANSVFVAPVTGTGSSACVVGLAADLAAGTGGITFASTDPAADLAGAIEDIAVQVCMAVGPGGEIGDGDGCPFNPDKSEPGVCGCGVPDVDRDGNGTIDCLEVAAPDIVAEEEIPLVGDAACGACGSAGAGFYSIATVAYGMLLFVRRRRR